MSFSKAKSKITATCMGEGISYSIDPYIFLESLVKKIHHAVPWPHMNKVYSYQVW